MAMLTLNGLVQNVFTKPESKDKETGEIRPSTENVQILAENFMESGEKRLEMVTLKVPKGEVYRKLVDHPAFIERIKYSERGVGSLELIKELLEFNNIIVPGVAYSADPVGTPGNKVKGSYLWGKDIVMAYVPPAPGKKVPAFGYEYTWTINGQEMSVDRWREDPRVSDLIRIRRRYDLKLTGVEIDPDSPDFGKSISGYLIKNAVA